MYIVLSRGCTHAQERDIAVANPVSKIDLKTYHIRAYEKDGSECCPTRYPQDVLCFLSFFLSFLSFFVLCGAGW